MLTDMHSFPEFIDLDKVDLTDVGVAKKTRVTYTDHNEEINILLIKNIIVGHISLIHEIYDSDDMTHMHQIFSNLKNTIILHSKTLRQYPNLIDIIENNVSMIKSTYDKYVIHKMLINIKTGRYKDNMHFRSIADMNSTTPPIPAEERLLIEKKLPHLRFSRQIKKNQKPFNVGEIVGAKDKENKWWLSRVLHRYDTPDSEDYWYYIRFENHDSIHDEWINSKTYKVRSFNPRKHFLKRPLIV